MLAQVVESLGGQVVPLFSIPREADGACLHPRMSESAGVPLGVLVARLTMYGFDRLRKLGILSPDSLYCCVCSGRMGLFVSPISGVATFAAFARAKPLTAAAVEVQAQRGRVLPDTDAWIAQGRPAPRLQAQATVAQALMAQVAGIGEVATSIGRCADGLADISDEMAYRTDIGVAVQRHALVREWREAEDACDAALESNRWAVRAIESGGLDVSRKIIREYEEDYQIHEKRARLDNFDRAIDRAGGARRRRMTHHSSGTSIGQK